MVTRAWLLLFALMGCGGGTLPAGGSEAGVGDVASAPPPDAAPPDVAGDSGYLAPDVQPDIVPPDTIPIDRAPARLTIDRTEATFTGALGCDPSEPVTFRVTNSGGTATGSLVTTLTGPFITAADGCSVTSLAPGASCDVQVRFAPKTPGLQTGLLSAVATPGGEVRAALSGTVLTVEAPATIPSSADYGTVYLDSTSPPRSFEIRNTGGAPLKLDRAKLSTGEFLILKDSCSDSAVPPGGTCEIQVVFRPVSSGVKTALLTISAPGCGGGTIQVPLAGTGIPDPVGHLPPLNFGSVPVHHISAALASTIFNTGTMNTGPLEVSIVGPSASQFVITASTCTSLAPGESCRVTMEFRPTTAGDKQAQLIVKAATGMSIASLSGYGFSP